MGICRAFEVKQATTFIHQYGKPRGYWLNNGTRKNEAFKLEAYPLNEEEYREKQRMDEVVESFKKSDNEADCDSICLKVDDEDELFEYLQFTCTVGIRRNKIMAKPSLRSMMYLRHKIFEVLASEDEEFARDAVIKFDWRFFSSKVSKKNCMEFYKIIVQFGVEKEVV